MSISSDDAYEQEDIARVLEMAREPSYLSEIARKLEKFDPDWAYTGTNSVERVAITASMMDDRDDVEFTEVGYGGNSPSQSKSSPMFSLSPNGEDDEPRWNPYTVMEYTSEGDLKEEYRDVVDPTVTTEEKVNVIENLSNVGNEVSKDAEAILQDVMRRQFKHYDLVETPDYNDPGVDFYVEDERNRSWGLAIEVSVRWVNPIDKPYFDSKFDKATEKDADLAIIAPRFTDQLLEEYEDPDSKYYNTDPEGDMAHLHRVPTGEPSVYFPFSKKPSEIKEREPGGNPIIVPDSSEAMDKLERTGNVGEDYPVVTDSRARFISSIDVVHRDATVVTESEFRNELRESIEPLLWEFLRPYKIEQFLVDTYWDRGLNQSEIGKLVDRSGSTIGEWMRKWGVIRRGTGAPELTDETVEIWSRMYRGEDPFEGQFSGYRILAEYNRHPMWGLDDWEEWYQDTTEEERRDAISIQDSYRDTLGYTLMFGPEDRLQPSYSFVLKTLKENGVDVRDPDEAPRVPYSAYPSKDALEYMLNKNQDTIVDVSE